MKNPFLLIVLTGILLTLNGCATTPAVSGQAPTLRSNQTASPPSDLFTYRAIIREVYDGDTVTADIDLGFHTWIHGEKLRLYGIDAPEMRGEERPQGIRSRDWLRNRILGKEVLIHTIQDRKGKYGRYLAETYLDGSKINDELVSNGMAVYREY